MDSTAYIVENEALRAENARLREQLTVLAHELTQLKRLIFGARSERFEPSDAPETLSLFGETLAEVPATVVRETITRTREKRKPVRQGLPAHLPREVIVIEPDEDTQGLKKIGEEVTETLDYRPAKLVVIRRVRPKYVDPGNEAGGVVIGELPARPIEKGIAEPGLLAHVLVEKYVDHIPLYRQVQRFKREGLVLPASTLEGWTAATASLLTPLYEAMVRRIKASPYIQADCLPRLVGETPIPVQDADKKGTTHRGYYWVYHAPLERSVVLDYRRGRDRDGPASFLNGYQGALQSDGYAAYDELGRWPGITSYGCWAHARRHFFEAKDSDAEFAEHALREIGLLYDIERRLREEEALPERRGQVRQKEAIPILDRFNPWLQSHPGLPKSPWGQAVSYALLRWDKLCRYTEDGRVEIDNNLVENAIRPIALGRKNYLFAGSHDAAQRAAVIYSLLGTCKMHEVNPQAWLNDVLSRIPTHPHKQIDELLPHHWKKSNM